MTDPVLSPPPPAHDRDPSQIDRRAADRPARRRGRPRALDDDKCRTICMLDSTGFSQLQAARFVGCAPSTLLRHRRHDRPFDTALREAFSAATARERRMFRKGSANNWRFSKWFLNRAKRGRETPLCPEEITLRLMWILKSFLCHLVRQEAGEEVHAQVACRMDEEFRKLEVKFAARVDDYLANFATGRGAASPAARADFCTT
jgi:hypothetical protein